MATRQLTVGELIDYLQQFNSETAVFPDSGPHWKWDILRCDAQDKPYIVLDAIDYRIEQE